MKGGTEMERRRFGQVGRLKPEKRDEYVRLHAEVWPDVLNMITACNLENYSIFIRGNVVFSYFEYTGTDYEADMAKMAADETTQRWWRCTRPCFEVYDEACEEAFYTDMDSIFYLK